MLISVCKVFPSALHYVLLGNNSPYIRNYEHREELGKSGQDVGDLANSMESDFFDHIVTHIRSDIQALDGNYLLQKKGIQAFHTKSLLKIASQTHLIFSLSTERTGYLATAGGTIRAGSFVRATDISLNLNMAHILCILEFYNRAIEEFDNVIRNARERRAILKVAWNNKGLCYKAQQKSKEAMQCYEEAIRIDSDCVEALSNLAVCYQELGEEKKTEELKKKIENLL